MAGLFDDLVPQAQPQAIGPAPAPQAGPPGVPQFTPEQLAYAQANAQYRDPAAQAGSPTNPSYDAPGATGDNSIYHVSPQGGLSDPGSQGSLFGDLVPAANGGGARSTSQGLGFIEGVAKPFQNFSAANDATLGSLPGVGGLFHSNATDQAAQQGMQHWFSDMEKTQQPGQIGKAAGEFVGTLPIVWGMGPGVGGAVSGALTSDAKTPLGVAGDAALSALVGKGADLYLNAVKNIVQPVVSPAIRTLMDAKIPLTPGQIAGGALKRIEDGATSIPIFGDMIKNAQGRSIAGLNRAVINRSLAPIGGTLPPDVSVGREGIAYAGDQLSNRYNSLLSGLTIKADPQFAAGMTSMANTAANMPSEHGKMFERFVRQNVLDRFTPGGDLTGDAMKDAETSIGLKMKRYSSSPMPADQDFADALGDLQAELRGLVARSNPAVAGELQNLNKGWANLAIAETAGGRQGAVEGVFTPSQLTGAVRAANSTVRKRGFARGTALMQDLSDAAQGTLPSSVPDSGSPLRHALEAGVGLAVGKEAGLGGALARGAVVGSTLGLPYTRLGQRVVPYLMAGSRARVAAPLAKALDALRLPASRAAPFLPIAAVPQPGQ